MPEPEPPEDPEVIDVKAIWLTPAQVAWIATLSPSQQRRFDALRPPSWSFQDLSEVRQSGYRDFPSTLAFLLEVAEGGAFNDPIIAAEIERILGPAAGVAPVPEAPGEYPGLLGQRKVDADD